MRRTSFLVALTLGATIAPSLLAQCPDGTPPPCRGNTSAAGPAARRPNPPLDDRTWIILPFENVARVQDIDWLKDASVNLLYLDMSKWRDIRVVDDERVADLIREVPEARAGLTLQSGIAVARRAGAGKLVMGDLLKVGTRTQVVAKVYDVRTGQRLRNVREETASSDSLIGLFGRLARGILNVGALTDADLGIGTSRLEAYQAYVSGLTALNRVELDSAEARFQRAIALDSSFALAHYKISVVYGWINPGDRRRMHHAERANQLSATLPPRERQLILGQYQTSRAQWGDACATYQALLQADSNDVEAWYNVGECQFHDRYVSYLDGDTARPMFRGSWHTAMRAFQRALELDPTYHLAYAHIPDILLEERRIGCLRRDEMTGCGPAEQFIAQVLRRGDTLATVPVPAQRLDALVQQAEEANRQNTVRLNLRQTRALAQAWVNAGPDEARAHLALALALMRAGQPHEAAREFELGRAGSVALAEGGRQLAGRVELLFKLDSLAALGRLVDSLDARASRGGLDIGALIAINLGRWRRMGDLFGGNFQGPPQVRRFLVAGMQTMQGVAPDDLAQIELGLDSILQSAPAAQRRVSLGAFLFLTVPWSMALERPAQLHDTDTASADTRMRLVAHIVRRDTAAARATLQRLDSEAAASPRESPSAFPFQLSAEAHLWLGDSAAALARLLEWESRFPFQNPQSTYIAQLGNQLSTAVQTWGRTFLRLADLAAARGDTAAAVRNYRRVVGLWATADAAFQPMVQRSREALARLGG